MTAKIACLSTLLVAALTLPAAGQVTRCEIPQSPRNIDPKAVPSPYNKPPSRTSIVERIGPNSIVYQPRGGGKAQTLYLCSQHYHLPIETPQGCKGAIPPAGQTEPAPGQYVEIHTVYAANKERPHGCNPEKLECCVLPPLVVRGFAAKVTANGPGGPIVPPTGRPLAEWSGSATGADKVPNECKAAAQWSFRLSCDFTVSQAQLRQFTHADPARAVQPADRLSKDLTLVIP